MFSLKSKEEVSQYLERIEKQLEPYFSTVCRTAEHNQEKVLKAMQKHRLSDNHFSWHTGYGYDDPGREITEKIYADVFGSEDALVRPTIASGTHALTLMLTGLLRRGDKMISITGKPYDTLESVIGIQPSKSRTLIEDGILYEQIELLEDGSFDLDFIREKAIATPEYFYIQRSGGYAWRKSITISMIEEVCSLIKSISPNSIILCDNCYGEFMETLEPIHAGVDVMAGSLIKNPGGGLALSGGYVCGSKKHIALIADRLIAPGIGRECGLTFGQTRNILQGLFIAPSVVSYAVKGAMLCAKIYSDLGYEVNPSHMDARSDIIQAIKFGTPEKVIDFCQSVQYASPVGSHVLAMPWEMPGYSDKVIMASGAFVMGSSIELSADAPIREPYIAYYQGGLTYEHVKIALKYTLEKYFGLL